MISSPLKFNCGKAAARLSGAFALAISTSLHGASISPPTAAFIEKHCVTCHDAEHESRLDLTKPAYEPENAANFSLWVRIHDRVKAGEMPPKKKARPAPSDLDAFLKELTSTLSAAERALLAKEGRSVQRRLNRYEYENALRDLLSVPWAQVMNKLPPDGEAYRFNKSGEALDVSFVQMDRYMSSANYAMRQAMSAQLEHREKTTQRFYARDEPSLRNYLPRENGTLPDRLSFPVLDSHAQPDVRAGRAN